MGSLIAIDPGARTGWAMFEHGEFIRAGSCSHSRNDLLPSSELLPCDVIIERPVIYVHGPSKGDPNHIITLAIRAGIVAGWYHRNCSIHWVTPRVWKGSVPKKITTKRTLAKLSLEERSRIEGSDHNMLDAIGIGLWYLKR